MTSDWSTFGHTHKLGADWSVEEEWHRSADQMLDTRRLTTVTFSSEKSKSCVFHRKGSENAT